MMPLRCSDQSLRWMDITLNPGAGAVSRGRSVANCLLLPAAPAPASRKIADYIYKRLRIFLMRQVTAIQKHYQSRSWDRRVESFTICEWNLTIVFAPKQESGLFD